MFTDIFRILLTSMKRVHFVKTVIADGKQIQINGLEQPPRRYPFEELETLIKIFEDMVLANLEMGERALDAIAEEQKHKMTRRRFEDLRLSYMKNKNIVDQLTIMKREIHGMKFSLHQMKEERYTLLKKFPIHVVDIEDIYSEAEIENLIATYGNNWNAFKHIILQIRQRATIELGLAEAGYEMEQAGKHIRIQERCIEILCSSVTVFNTLLRILQFF